MERMLGGDESTDMVWIADSVNFGSFTFRTLFTILMLNGKD